ncbi:MAG: transglycosylase domain-containing protein [Myxococcales bacterium]|nr:transglycosylase domain-containing protein [Myxococcales bacterium]
MLRRITKWLKRLALCAVVLAVVGAGSVYGVIRYHEADLPSVEQLRSSYSPPQVTRVLARDGSTLASVFTERRTVVALADVSDVAKLAFLAAEDASFYEHKGLDYFGMLRALAANLRAGRTVQGGSTITQQVVKNLLLEPERTYRRKIRETILSRRLEQQLTKDEIFALYLNHIYLGHGRYGIEEAARFYFGKKAAQLDLPEAALLAGLVASPERYSPRKNPTLTEERRRYVLGQMLAKGFVTAELHAEASAAPIRLAPASEGESELAPEVVAHVSKLLENLVGERARRGGYTVSTTIDPTLQAAARQAVRKNLQRHAERQKLEPPHTATKRRLFGAPFEGSPRPFHAYVGRVTRLDDKAGTVDVQLGSVVGRVQLTHEERFNPKHLPPSEFTREGALLRASVGALPEGTEPVPARLELGPESSLVAIEPRTRQVLALIGSYEAISGGLDRATRARRQPGSAFKPFVYGYALHSRRFTVATMLALPASKDGKLGERSESVRAAIAQSDNAAAERLLSEVGAANVVEWARAAGIESRLEPTPSLALGAYEITPLEAANAYATFASGGQFAAPVLVTKIVGPDGKKIPLPSAPPSRRVMNEDEAYLVTSLLTSVVKDGTAKRALSLGRPVAGKTGTTNEAKDAWFIGYSTDIVCATWVGFDDAIPLGWGESGAMTALPAFIDFMKVAHDKKPATEFPRPTGIITVRVDPATGLLARPEQEDAKDEVFLDGTAPSEVAELDAGVDAAPEASAVADDDGGAALDPEAVQAGQAPGEPPEPKEPTPKEPAGQGDSGPTPELPPF